jgi:hypothetical protein
LTGVTETTVTREGTAMDREDAKLLGAVIVALGYLVGMIVALAATLPG